MVCYLWRFQKDERDESLQALHIPPHLSPFSPSPPPPHHVTPLAPEKVNNMYLTHHANTYEATAFTFLIRAPKSLEMSAQTLYSSCINTNMVGVKNIPYRKKDMSSSGAVIILFTMHSHDRLTYTLLISHNFTQQHTGEWAWSEYEEQTSCGSKSC